MTAEVSGELKMISHTVGLIIPNPAGSINTESRLSLVLLKRHKYSLVCTAGCVSYTSLFQILSGDSGMHQCDTFLM